MTQFEHIYIFNYNHHEEELCKFEAKHIFNQEIENKLIFSDKIVEPSSSAYIRQRLDIILNSKDYPILLDEIKKLNLRLDGFKVEYLLFAGDPTRNAERLNKCRDIAFKIEGTPNYYHPHTIYALCYYEGIWYFGTEIKNTPDWHKHKQKPHVFSSSINPDIAKALINTASQGNKDKKLIDTCCGVGTVLLEACYAGYNIEGCEIGKKVCHQARANLEHFNYSAIVHHSDIKDITAHFDAAIVDLPYNLFCRADDNTLSHIIKYSAEVADRLVIVSASDVSDMIQSYGLSIIDQCSIGKMGKTKFERKIWVCVK